MRSVECLSCLHRLLGKRFGAINAWPVAGQLPRQVTGNGLIYFAADGRGWTQMNRADSKFVGNALDLQARLREVQQQAQMQAGRFQVVYALRGARGVQRLAGFQFDDDRSLDDQSAK